MKYEMSGRSITIAIQALAIIGLATAVVFTARSAEDLAAAAATLFQNVDEPARNAYQQTVDPACPGNTICVFPFPAVAAKTIVRITNVSCSFNMAGPDGVLRVILSNGEPVQKLAYVPASAYGSPTTLTVNAAVNLYATTGSKPYVQVEGVDNVFSGVCTISGYHVNLS